MHIALFILSKVMMALVFICFLFEIYKKVIVKKLRCIEIKEVQVTDICRSMIVYNNLPKIQIVQVVNGINNYNPYKNRIVLKKITQVDLVDLIIATHEVGHYVDICGNSFLNNVAKKSMFFIAINRLVIIPIFLVNFFMNIIFYNKFSLSLSTGVTLFLIINFYIISFIRIITCIPLENRASRIAFKYISKHKLTEKENFVYIRRYYVLAEYSQLIVALAYIILITIIVMVSII